MQAILEFKLQPDMLSAHLRALTELKTSKDASEKWVKAVLRGAEELLSTTANHLKAGGSWEQGSAASGVLAQRVTAAIFTLGKASTILIPSFNDKTSLITSDFLLQSPKGC